MCPIPETEVELLRDLCDEPRVAGVHTVRMPGGWFIGYVEAMGRVVRRESGETPTEFHRRVIGGVA